MNHNKSIIRRIFALAALILICLVSAQADDPCANMKRRALVLSGGGSKGAFEAGAIYHLVVHRNCDFHEFSGVSVGALNGAFLAQAPQALDPVESQQNLALQAEGLVSLWQSVKGAGDIRKPRPLATVRWGLFGLESINDFGPLRRLLDRNISIEKLEQGRPVRTGVVSFWTGGYREIVAQPLLSQSGSRSFMEYLFASSVPPLYGKLPRIADGSPADNPKLWPQFTDGGLRHITPVASYFKLCKSGSCGTDPQSGQNASPSNSVFAAPPHTAIQQLFVIVTSPYPQDSDFLPPMDPSCCKRGRHQMTDGRKILGRTLALMDDAVYRSDLDFMRFANDLLRWRQRMYEQTQADADQTSTQQPLLNEFVVESYNRDERNPGAPSLPYDIGLIVPEKEAADPEHILVITPKIIQEQLLTGCLAADRMMQQDFNLPTMADQCTERFVSGRASQPSQVHISRAVVQETTENYSRETTGKE